MIKKLEMEKIIAQEKFARKPTVGQKAWGLIHKFYSVILDNMERESINKSELAKRLGISRSAVTQMFNKTPNVSVRKMVEIADAVGVELDLIDSISESSNHINDDLMLQTIQKFITLDCPQSGSPGGEVVSVKTDDNYASSRDQELPNEYSWKEFGEIYGEPCYA